MESPPAAKRVGMEEKDPGPVKMNKVIVLSEQSSHRTQIRGSHAGCVGYWVFTALRVPHCEP